MVRHLSDTLLLDGLLVLFKVARHKEQHKFSRLGSLNDESKSCASNLNRFPDLLFPNRRSQT